MTLDQFLSTVAALSGLTFVVASMLGTGLSLSVTQILQPLKNARLVILALILFVVGSLLIGTLMGGRDPAVRSVLGLGTAQRNVAAAILVASLNFAGTMTLPFVLVPSIVLPLILIPTARQLGGRGAQQRRRPSKTPTRFQQKHLSGDASRISPGRHCSSFIPSTQHTFWRMRKCLVCSL